MPHFTPNLRYHAIILLKINDAKYNSTILNKLNLIAKKINIRASINQNQ